MAILNEYNDQNKHIIHLMITNKCNRKCLDCCNNQYNVNNIPVIIDEELLQAKDVFLTGGEPFAYAYPNEVARILKVIYKNINRVFVYTNACELVEYVNNGGKLDHIDGLTISIKNKIDKEVFEKYIAYNEDIYTNKCNRVYLFEGFEDTNVPYYFDTYNRKWQKNFVAAPYSIFRRNATFAEDGRLL